jgi:acyl dehydratase
MKYFEDFAPGDTSEYGAYTVTREEVLEFAGKYDPQPFHLDDDAAAQTFFGKISASGWHTCAMTMRMMVDQMKVTQAASEGSPGVDKIRWHRPVYPGDTLRVRTKVDGKKDLPSKPHLGLVLNRYEVLNQESKIVMTFEAAGIFKRRPAP